MSLEFMRFFCVWGTHQCVLLPTIIFLTCLVHAQAVSSRFYLCGSAGDWIWGFHFCEPPACKRETSTSRHSWLMRVFPGLSWAHPPHACIQHKRSHTPHKLVCQANAHVHFYGCIFRLPMSSKVHNETTNVCHTCLLPAEATVTFLHAFQTIRDPGKKGGEFFHSRYIKPKSNWAHQNK